MKYITFRELLNLIHEWEQPNKVYLTCNNTEWEWDSVDEEYYYRNSRKFNNVYTQDTTLEEVVSDIYTAKQLAGKEIIMLLDEILTDKEKEYLKAFIKPFRNRVKTIERRKNKEWERILVFYKDYDDTSDNVRSYMSLPMFEAGTMYRGMELDKEYTLEELGL